MTPEEISLYRLSGQRLAGSRFTSATEVVEWMGAIQAQDYEMAKWAVGCRLPGSTAAEIESTLNRGEIIRTHILRPTWHLVAASDLRWMLALTAPRIKKICDTMGKKIGLDSSTLKTSHKIIEKTLGEHGFLSRKEIVQELKRGGVDTSELRNNLIIMQAELAGIICNGPRREKQLTYALLDERVPASPALSREEALAKLAHRYFTSHGPATVYDFVWWAGLTLSDAREGLESVKADFLSTQLKEETYCFNPEIMADAVTVPDVLLLPAFDEFLVSYKDRSPSLKSEVSKLIITKNGIFKPVVVVNGQVEGLWKRTTKNIRTVVELQYFGAWNVAGKEQLSLAVEKYRSFLKTEVVIRQTAPEN